MKPNIKRTGDSAFPCTKEQHAWFPGMHLRDYFAAKAFSMLLHPEAKNHTPEATAIEAYRFADAMLKEREK